MEPNKTKIFSILRIGASPFFLIGVIKFLITGRVSTGARNSDKVFIPSTSVFFWVAIFLFTGLGIYLLLSGFKSLSGESDMKLAGKDMNRFTKKIPLPFLFALEAGVAGPLAGMFFQIAFQYLFMGGSRITMIFFDVFQLMVNLVYGFLPYGVVGLGLYFLIGIFKNKLASPRIQVLLAISAAAGFMLAQAWLLREWIYPQASWQETLKLAFTYNSDSEFKGIPVPAASNFLCMVFAALSGFYLSVIFRKQFIQKTIS